MKLQETAVLMASDDYKDRFVGEFAQLMIRINGLSKMLDDLDRGTLAFKLKSSPATLAMQLYHMEKYAKMLKLRAEQEGIELPNV